MGEVPHGTPYGMHELSAKALERIELYAGKPLTDLSIEELHNLSGMFDRGSSLDSCTIGGTGNWHDAIEMTITLQLGARANALSLQAGIGDPEEREIIYSADRKKDSGSVDFPF